MSPELAVRLSQQFACDSRDLGLVAGSNRGATASNCYPLSDRGAFSFACRPPLHPASMRPCHRRNQCAQRRASHKLCAVPIAKRYHTSSGVKKGRAGSSGEGALRQLAPFRSEMGQRTNPLPRESAARGAERVAKIGLTN